MKINININWLFSFLYLHFAIRFSQLHFILPKPKFEIILTNRRNKAIFNFGEKKLLVSGGLF